MNDIKLIVTLLVFVGGCTTGSATVLSGWESSPIDLVAVTFYDEPPANYEVVGNVKAESFVFPFILLFYEKKAEARAFAELKKQAATIGANGVIGWAVGEIVEWNWVHDANTGTSSYKPSKRITVRGTAIYVTSINRSD